MRPSHLVSLLVVVGAACAPAARSGEIPPATVESGPRYRLVYVQLGSANVEPKVVDEVALVIQQELAHKGLLLAAAWETPTLVVRYALRGATEGRFDVRTSGTAQDVVDGGRIQPVAYSRYVSNCDGSTESRDHCSALDEAIPLLPRGAFGSAPRRSLGMEIRVLDSDRLLWSDVRSDEGEWTPGRALRIRPLVQATLTQMKLEEAP